MRAAIGPCRVEELPQLNELANRVFRGRRPGDMAGEYPLLFAAENVEQLRVAREGGRIVGHVGVCLRDVVLLGCRVTTASIGAVCTDPDFRGQGIASALMADATAHSRAHGASLMLISGTRGLYRRLGYVQVGRFSRYTSGPGGHADDTMLGPPQPGRCEDAVHLHQREPVRFLRPREDWERLLAAGMLMNRPADLLPVFQGSLAVAYLAVQRPAPGADGTPGIPEVMEYAGDRRAVASGFRQLAAYYAAPGAALIAPADDEPLRIALERLGCVPEPERFSGTLGIIDPQRFFADLRPYLAERLGSDLGGIAIEPAGAGAAFRFDGDECRMETMSALTTLVFGDGVPEEDEALPPGAPGLLLRRAFPMPLPWYGYNYV